MLANLWLVSQPTDYIAMMHILHVLKALKMAVKNLCSYYQSALSYSNGPKFPLQFNVPIAYREELEASLYRGIHMNKDVIVKFALRYGEKVHRFCEEKGYALKLYCCKKVTLQYTMVVMEEVKGCTLDEYAHKLGKTAKKPYKASVQRFCKICMMLSFAMVTFAAVTF